MTARSRAHVFNTAAAQYAAHRPSYPPALFDAVEELADRSLNGARVYDIGAGTGIATAQLGARGARVTAVEPGAGMAAEFRRALPQVPLVRGDGNALPFADASADFLTFAQSWHWTDPERSVPEVHRVLRPGGALALWWNVSDENVPWVAAQDRRIKDRFGPFTAAHGSAGRFRSLHGLDFTHRRIPWSRRITLDQHLANLGSHSLFLVQDPADTTSFFTAERARLLETFPDGMVRETYYVDLLFATVPGAAAP